jgi:hypothetical protein
VTLNDLKHITDQLLVRNPSLPLHPLRFRRKNAPLAVPELQGVGYGQAAAQLRGALIMPLRHGWWCVAGFLIAFVATGLLRGCAARRLLDQPDSAQESCVRTPRGGGLSSPWS